MSLLWHPHAERQVVGLRQGKKWSGGTGNPKFLFHTMEFTNRWPRYAAPPHMTHNPFTGELRQHIPFDRAAYSVRSGKVDSMKFVYQIEHWGKAADVPSYPVAWYRNVANLIQWFHDNLGVPLAFADFTTMRYGEWAPQRLAYSVVDGFAGVIGHAHVGRGIDKHWDPGKLNVQLLVDILGTAKPAPPPPPIMDDEMGAIIDGLKEQTMAWYEELQDQTGVPGGNNPAYWGIDYLGVGPTDDE